MVLAPCLERASQDFNIFARDMESFMSACKLDGAGGTDSGGEGQNVVTIYDGGFADAKEVFW
jgi:hypothetical protein